MSGQHVRAAIIAAALAVAALSPAFAQDRGRHEGREREWRGGDWHDRDIRRFHEHDFDRWRGGRWVHVRHGGRFGWWWVVGPSWYFYPAPIYPYPNPYTPPYAAPGGPAWYFCPPAQAYYPYVPSCPVPWQIVPAQ
jgi:hypothetical protein